ncbi:MAG: hypothetical protein WCI92_12810 [Bacteroidota bacterium]
MKINRENYEAYFLDYHEGQLSHDMVKEVLCFVEQNPDLKNEFEEFEAVSLVMDQDITFEKKSSLKKNQVFATSQVNELNYEEYLVGETEGLLNTDQLASLDEFISINPQIEKDRRLYALTHLTPEISVVFEAKESLKKKAIPVGMIDGESFETFMARELEGDLNTDEKLQLAEFLQYNPHLEHDRKLYTHTILSAEADIVFKDKNSLKKSVIPLRRIVYYALSAAASLALVLSVYFLLDRNNIPQNIAGKGEIESTLNKVITGPTRPITDKQVAVITNQANTKATTTNQAISVLPGNGVNENTIIDQVGNGNKNQAIAFLQPRTAVAVTTRSFVDPQFTFIRVSQMYTNQNREFYYNLKLSDDIQYAQLNSDDKNPAKTIFKAATGKISDLFASNQTSPPREEKKNLSMWTFAELGVQTFNTITSSELELNLRKDEEGKVVGYNVESGLVDFEREVKR